MEIKLTNENFTEEVLESKTPVLVDFWASWCGPCTMLSPILEEVAKEKEGIIKVGKVNVDEEAELATKYGIISIPFLAFFKDGKLVKSSVGLIPKEDILALID